MYIPRNNLIGIKNSPKKVLQTSFMIGKGSNQLPTHRTNDGKRPSTLMQSTAETSMIQPPQLIGL